MTTLNIPSSPSQGDTYEANGVVYTWDGTKWKADSSYVSNLNGGPLGGFRNQIINGNLEINQRSVTDITSTSGFMADRWFKGSESGFRAVVSDTTPDGFTKSFALSGANDNPMYQNVELPEVGKAGKFYVGSQWTLSCWARCANGGNFRLGKRFVNDFNTNKTDESAQTFTLDGTWTKVAFTFTIGAAPNATNTSMQVQFVGLTPNEIFCTGFQLEPGPVATPFEHRPIGTELALCQRYYYKSSNSTENFVLWATGGSNNAACIIKLPVPMRQNPSCSVGSFGPAYGASSPYGTVTSLRDISMVTNSNVPLRVNWTGSAPFQNRVNDFAADAEL